MGSRRRSLVRRPIISSSLVLEGGVGLRPGAGVDGWDRVRTGGVGRIPRAHKPAGCAKAVIVAVLNEALLGLGVAGVDVGAEAALVTEAALEEAHAEAQVVARLELLPEQLLSALPADGEVVVALCGWRRGGVGVGRGRRPRWPQLGAWVAHGSECGVVGSLDVH
jgi:hypothetical protein